MHSEGFQHLRGAAEPNNPAPLFDRQRGEEYRYQTVLSPRKSVSRMAGDLKQELAVPAFVQELARDRPLHWQPAENERPGSEAEVLVRLPPFHPHAGNCLGSAEPLLRKSEVAANLAKNCSG
jgi:hypothetical protein